MGTLPKEKFFDEVESLKKQCEVRVKYLLDKLKLCDQKLKAAEVDWLKYCELRDEHDKEISKYNKNTDDPIIPRFAALGLRYPLYFKGAMEHLDDSLRVLGTVTADELEWRKCLEKFYDAQLRVSNNMEDERNHKTGE